MTDAGDDQSGEVRPRRVGALIEPGAPGDRWGAAAPMLYPNAYAWLVLVSSMDVMLTWRILDHGGTEVNPIARMVIDAWELPGAIAFKFGLMLFVIIVCEAAGRSSDRLGRGLAYVSVATSSVPVVYSLALLVYHILIAPGGF